MKMRVMIISSEFPPGPGGIGTHAMQLAANLSRAGWEVLVASPQTYASIAEIDDFNRRQSFHVRRFAMVPFPPLKALYRLAVSYGEAQRFRPDVLIGSGERAVWLAWGVSRALGLPWLAVGHAMEFGVRKAWQRTVNRRIFGQADAVVCVSRYTWNRMIEFGVSPNGGGVIANGADHEAFGFVPETEMVRVRSKYGLGSSRFVITVGSVTNRKGQDTVIRALPAILERIPDLIYVIVGWPAEVEAFSALARDVGVSGCVRFLGRVPGDDVVALLNAADLFLMTSRHTDNGDFEGFGIAVAEAALCGRASIVTAASGVAEAIIDGETGLAVPENDPPAVAAAAIRLLSQAELRAAMERNARRRAAEEQTWVRRVGEYDHVLRGIVLSKSF